MTRATLPARPNLEFLKKLAKKRLREMRGDAPSAKLADAQLAVARTYGFASWRKLKAHVESLPTAPAAAAATPYEDPFVTSLPAHRRKHKVVAWKPLMDAAFAGDVARARKLLDAGADPNIISTTPHRYRPLHRAIESKKTQPRGPEHERVVELLLQRGADPKLRGTFGQLTALQLAAAGETRFVPMLLPRFQPLDLFHAAAVGDDARVAALLKKQPSLAVTLDTNGWTALLYCCASALFKSSAEHDRSLVRIAGMLLGLGADPMAGFLFDGKWPLRPLYFACGLHDNPAVAELLFRVGATPYDDETVYHAADEGHEKCLSLIEKYADPAKLADEAGKNLAAMFHWGHTRGARWLLEHGADPNRIFPRFGNSALHEAVIRRANDATLKLLLKHGGDPTVKNRDGKTAIDLARASDMRGPNRPCPTGRDGAPGSPQKVKAAARMLAILRSASPASSTLPARARTGARSKKGARR
jgi:ankyrin repeat protein